MLSLRSGSNGVKELFLSSCGFRCLLLGYYSATTPSAAAVSTKNQAHFMVDYLINSLGFCREEAISVSSKVSHLKSTKNADLLLHVFKQYGLDKMQIRSIVSSVPQVLLHKADKTLEPKLRVLHELGLSGSEIVKRFQKDRTFLRTGLDSAIMPSINYLRNLLGSDEQVVKTIYRFGWFLSTCFLKRLQVNVALLQGYGFSDEMIRTHLVLNPRCFIQIPEKLKDDAHRVETELGIPRNSKMFLYGIVALGSVSRLDLQRKFQILRSFGWSDLDISTLARTQPLCLSQSETKIRNGLNFYMKQLGYSPTFMASHAVFLMYSLENRVKPRSKVWKILKEKNLVKSKPSLGSVLNYSELNFVKFLQRFENEIPKLCETYTNSKRNVAGTK